MYVFCSWSELSLCTNRSLVLYVSTQIGDNEIDTDWCQVISLKIKVKVMTSIYLCMPFTWASGVWSFRLNSPSLCHRCSISRKVSPKQRHSRSSLIRGLFFKLRLRHARWRHQMETFSALLAICAGNSPVPGEFPTQRPVTRSFDVYFDLCPNKRLSKQSCGWWLETLS